MSLAQLQRRAGYLAAAKQSFERLIALGNRIEDEQQRHWAHFLSGDVEAALGNRNAALDQYERGQALVQDLIRRDPNNAEWQRDLSVSYNKIGDISAARGDRDGALKAYKDGLEIAKRSPRAIPTTPNGSAISPSAMTRSAISAPREATATARSRPIRTGWRSQALAARDPNNAEWQRDLSVSYNKIGDISAARGDRDGALKAYKDGLDIAKRSPRAIPTTPNGSAISPSAMTRVGDISAARGDRDGALKAYKDGLDIAKRSPRAIPTTPNGSAISPSAITGSATSAPPEATATARSRPIRTASTLQSSSPRAIPTTPNGSAISPSAMTRVGDISAARGDRDGALKAYKDGLDIRKQLAARDPNNAEWQRDLSVSYNKIGDISAARGDRDGALKAYKDGLDIRKAARRARPQQRRMAARSLRQL